MSHMASSFPDLSVHLSRVLDEIGLNELTVMRRRQCYLQWEALHTLIVQLSVCDWSVHNFGSQIEGTTTPGLHSDMDTLFCVNFQNFIQDWPQWQPGKNVLMIQEEDTAPGYCRLQILIGDMLLPWEDLICEVCEYDNCKRLIMKNTILTQFFQREMIHGPALTLAPESGCIDVDMVFALKCETWPVQARPWLDRHRSGHWPTRTTLRLATETGCYLVPVGHRLSPTESLEWRISPSLTERSLMFSLNIVQIKCYVILKIIAKLFLKPNIPDGSISSYHFKTAVFYAIEGRPHVWNEKRLLECVTYCLCIVKGWVVNSYAPNYLIPEENLFAGRLTTTTRTTLIDILEDLITSNGRYLLHVTTDDIGHRLLEKLSRMPFNMQLIASPETVKIIGYLETMKHGTLKQIIIGIMRDEKMAVPVLHAIQKVRTMITAIWDKYRHATTLQKQTYKSVISMLSTWLGSMMSSVSIYNTQTIPREVIYLFDTGTYSDVATSRLKLASAFYCNKDYLKAEIVLVDLESRYNIDVIESVCKCACIHKRENKREYLRNLYTRSTYYNGNQLVAHCVVFTRHEIFCVPYALRSEMFRSEVSHDVFGNDNCIAIIDSLPYLYYLQYLTYSQLQERDLKERALDKLHGCIFKEPNLSHLETAWKLLGNCMELEQKPEIAHKCYRKSLEVRPRNNSDTLFLQYVFARMRHRNEHVPAPAATFRPF